MKSYPTYLQSFVLLLILLLCSVVSALVIMPFYSVESGIGISLIYTLSMIMTIAVALFIRGQYTFSTKSFSPSLILVASVTIVSLHLFIDPITSLVPLSDSLKGFFRETIQHPVSFFTMIVIAAPVLEELLFRGVVLDGLLKNYDPLKAIGFSALLFAIVHGNLAQGIGAFMIGLLIGWIYWKTESVIPGILIHLMNNLVSFLLIISMKEDELFTSFSEQIGNPMVYWLLIVLGGLTSAAGTWLLHKKYFKKKAIFLNLGNEIRGV